MAITPVSPTATDAPTGPIALAGAPRPAGAPKPKPRKRVNTAEKRHQHNAIERQRRETLNSKFLVLARLLPSLAACRRPSKSAIVNGSISHLSHQRQQRLLAAKLLRQLTAERDELFAEVNQWRQANGCAPKAGPAGAWTDEMEEVCTVEKETFGSFANVDDGGDDGADDEAEEMNLQKANLIAGNLSSGLITPRSSMSGDSASGYMEVKQEQINWSSSFSMAPSVPFNAFMNAESSETSSSNSPVNSNPMLTPPVIETNGLSPHSSSVDSPSSTTTPQSQWTQQHLAFFQQQMQHQNMQRQLAAAATLAPQQQQDMANLFLAQAHGNAGNTNMAQLMATMFPQQRDMSSASPAAGNDDWRKLSMGMLPQATSPSADIFKFGGFAGLGNGWNSEQAVGV